MTSRVRWLPLLALVTVLAYSQELPWVHYKAGDAPLSLPSNHIMQVHQDRTGYLWICLFSSGIMRFDGVSSETFGLKDGLADLFVYQIIEDQEGYLWVGGAAGLSVSSKPLHTYEIGEKPKFVSTFKGQPLWQNTIKERRLTPDTGSGMWVGTVSDGVKYFGDQPYRDLPLLDLDGNPMADVNVECLATTHMGTLWAGLSMGVARWDRKAGGMRLVLPTSTDQIPTIIFQDRENQMWMGAKDGTIWRMHLEGNGVALEHMGALQESIASFLELPNEQLLICSYGGGMMMFDRRTGQKRKINIDHGLISNLVQNASLDREGNIWISQNQGLSKLRPNWEAHQHYSMRIHMDGTRTLPAAGVLGVNARLPNDPLGDIWTGTQGGGAVKIGPKGESVIIGVEDGLKSALVNSVRRDPVSERVWMGNELGIDVYSPEPLLETMPGIPIQEINRPDLKGYVSGFHSRVIHSIAVLQLPVEEGLSLRETAYFFLSTGGVFLFVAEKWYFIGPAGGLAVGDHLAATINPEGTIWIGTQHRGLFRSQRPITLSLLEHLPTGKKDTARPPFVKEIGEPIFEFVWGKPKARTNHIRSLEWQENKLWVGSADGLALVDPKTHETQVFLSGEDGLAAENATSMDLSHDGLLWLGTNGGLSVVDTTYNCVLRSVSQKHGLLADEVWFLDSVNIGIDGLIYFGNAKGLSIYNPDREAQSTRPPPLVFKDIQWQPSSEGKNHFHAEYRALTYRYESGVLYQTRLRGFDRTWSKLQSQSSSRYTNLPAFWSARQYHFEVRASHPDGQWQTPSLIYSFEVEPPLIYRWWSICGCFLLLVLLVVGFVRWRTRILKQRTIDLKTQVDIRTAELRQRNEDLVKLNEEIVATQKQMVTREKMASLGTLTRGVAHELRNPMNFINNLSEINASTAAEAREILSKTSGNPQDIETCRELMADLVTSASIVQKHGKSAEHIVARMLELSKSGTGTPVSTDINLLVEEYSALALQSFVVVHQEMDIQLSPQLCKEQPFIPIFPNRMGRVVVNLVSNALESFLAHKQSDQAPLLVVGTRCEQEHVIVFVRDNGPGIAPEHLDQLFTPFFTTKSPSSNHVGLGLTVCYDVVQEHGGLITVCTDQTGTCIEVELPRRSPLQQGEKESHTL